MSGPVEGQSLDTPRMSLRDWFAGQAISAIIVAVSAGQHRTYEANTGTELPPIMAADAYDIADAMLAAREPKP